MVSASTPRSVSSPTVIKMTDTNYKGHRNSYTELNAVYFWTITIRNWIPLLNEDAYKQIIISSLKWLCDNKLIEIYGYVIMPNHIHLLWQQFSMNGKEFPKNSFEKFTAHQFQKKLLAEEPERLIQFSVSASDRKYNFWQRDPLAVHIFSKDVAEQKLNYSHYNPLQEHWRLCQLPEDYRFSSARFYETGFDEFGILTHYIDAF
jgi:putative transposase